MRYLVLDMKIKHLNINYVIKPEIEKLNSITNGSGMAQQI